MQDYVRAIRENAIAGLQVPPGRWDLQDEEALSISVYVRDERDRVVQRYLSDFLAEIRVNT
jgi:hypothetical protein